jgi:hypothetical protein
MVSMANAKPVGKQGRRRKVARAKGVKVFTELRLVDYSRFRRIAYRRQLKLSQLFREIVLSHLRPKEDV